MNKFKVTTKQPVKPATVTLTMDYDTAQRVMALAGQCAIGKLTNAHDEDLYEALANAGVEDKYRVIQSNSGLVTEPLTFRKR